MGKFLAVASFYNNTDAHIKQTFDNVLNQTHEDWLLIVGDDFSDDESFRRRLKAQVEQLNDKRILYYPTQFKRELYLYQNTFQYLDYDYYFDLDADDILDPNLFKIYDQHFQDYPDVYSIFCDYNQVDEAGNLEQWSAVQPSVDYLTEWQFRHNAEFWDMYKVSATQKMFGVARAMRKPNETSLPILESCKTATDTYFLFYNLSRGKHLHIPRRLYTYVRRPGSDSGHMTAEEHEKFNLNASQFMQEDDDWLWGAEPVYDRLWHVTTAISTCKWLDSVDEFAVMSRKLSAVEMGQIRALYPDKTIVFNEWYKNSIAVLQDSTPTELLERLKECTKFSAMSFNDDFNTADEATFNQINELDRARFTELVGGDFESYTFFRQQRYTRDDGVIEKALDWSGVKFHYRSGPDLRCDKVPAGNWSAQFVKDGNVVWEREIVDGFWARYSEDYFQNWSCNIVDSNTKTVVHTITPDLSTFGVQIDSGSLGDTLSWMGQIEELTQQRDFDLVYVRCHKPWLFDSEYYRRLNIRIVDFNGPWADNWQGLGVYAGDDPNIPSPKDKHPRDWRSIPLGAIAADQLGIKYRERKPKLAKEFYENLPVHDKPGVCIATHSTAQAKYWNREGGWQSLVDSFKAKGWNVYYVSKEDSDLTGVEHIKDIFDAGRYMVSTNKFVGISSGLSWLAWALDVDVCMISGFTWEFVEFDCDVRIINHNVCAGCWTWAKFDRGDWNWCPQWKDTPRHFECTKTISPEYVLQEIETAGWFNI